MNPPGASSAEDFTTSLPDTWQAELARRAVAAPTPADERIAVIEDSLACFTYGWLACIPFVGVGYLYPAVRRFVSARRRKVDWNPARGYLAAGMLLTSAGWLVGVLSWILGLTALMELGDPTGPEVPVAQFVFGSLLLNSPVVCIGLLLALATRFPEVGEFFKSRKFLTGLKRLGIVGVVVAVGRIVWAQFEWPNVSSETAAAYQPAVALSFWLSAALGFLPLWKLWRDTTWVFCLIVMVWLLGVLLLVQRVFSG